jgi:hypothetical protein
MKKNNKQSSQRGLTRHAKNKKRLERAHKLRTFNEIAYRVKAIQEYMKQQTEKAEKTNG